MKHKRIAVAILCTVVMVSLVWLHFSPVNLLRKQDWFEDDSNESGDVCKKNTERHEPLNDFHNYPCLEKDPASQEMIPGGCVRTVCKEPKGTVMSHFTKYCVPLKQVGQSICTYDPEVDLVSKYIHEHHEWEPTLIDNLLNTLKKYPDLVFLDIGCNIGVYTIAAASINTRTYCVDANQENLRLVSKSLSNDQLEKHVTIIWNALSDHRGEVAFKVVKGNAGASRLGDTERFNMTIEKQINVSAIMLDDLEWLFRGKQLFLKIDLESYELFLLRGAFEFFSHLDVRFIQMELVENDTFSAVVDLLYSWGYLMFRDPTGKVRLDRKDFVPGLWPGDVYFIKLTHLHGQ